jgi:succinoglycan biosynthesis transport protein ExoP
MLQATKPFTPEIDAPPASSPRELVHWALGIVRRQFVIITSVALIVASLGAVYTFTAPPTYTADATILIDPRRVQLFPGATFAEGQMDASALESQVELVKSEAVALAVVKQLRLANDAEFLSSDAGPFGVLRSALYYFVPNEPNKPLSEFEATRAALGVLSKNLTANRVGFSYNLAIKYRALRPDQAAQIANAIAESYIAEQLKGKYESTKRATGWLSGRIEELNQKRALAERAVVDFKQRKNMIITDGKLLNEQQIAELNSQLGTAVQKASEEKARLDRIDVVIRDDAADINTSGTVADTLNNPIVTQLRTRYLELVNREANWSRKYGANHLAVVNLRNQIRDVRGSILDELKRLRESYLSNLEIAKQQAQDLEKRLNAAVSQSQTTNQAQVALRELESSAQSYRTMHDSFLQRYTESLQQQSFPISDARVIAEASPPLGKSGPKTGLILVMAAAGGLALGVGVGMVRELMNGTLFTGTQVESALQMSCIALVPSLEIGKQQAPRPSRPLVPDRCSDGNFDSRRIVSRDPNVFWAVIDSPFSRFAEAIRSIKLAIDLNNGSVNGKQVIGFTSSLPNEGKSTISASLALLAAQAGARVILVDCDLRNPSLSRKLASRANLGILDVISGAVSLQDALWTDLSTNLAFLPGSNRTRVANSSDFLAADATKALFRDLGANYDYVIVDLPPLMPVVDTRATTGFVDSYVCVTEWGRTNVEAVRHSFRDAQIVYQNLLGFVLNKANIDRLSSYDPVGKNYYRNKYYSQYGLTE